MPRRPVSDIAKHRIVGAYLALREEKGREPSASAVLKAYRLQVGDSFEKPRYRLSLRSVQRILKELRVRVTETETDPLQQPWSMATLDLYPLPPDTLPAVLRVWKARVEESRGFTVREAQWTARLSFVAGEEDTKYLSFKAAEYAHTELEYGLIDRPFDSTMLDRDLMGLMAVFTGKITDESALERLRYRSRLSEEQVRRVRAGEDPLTVQGWEEEDIQRLYRGEVTLTTSETGERMVEEVSHTPGGSEDKL